jgi:hypothetical protein
MLVGSLIDTALNLMTFAFIGACAWLSSRDLPSRSDKSNSDGTNPN